MSALLLGLDIGTSSVKAAVFDSEGRALSIARVPQPVYSPQPGWAEQDALDWKAGAWQALRQALSGHDPRQIAAIGLSGQCPSHVLVDSQGEPLGRAIIWRDTRAVAEAAWLQQAITPKQALDWTGTASLGEASLSPARLLWLRKNRPEAWRKAGGILQPKDYIGLNLTGQMATDLHSAYCLANPASGEYAPELLDLLEVSSHLLPAPRPATALLGEVTPQAAHNSGLPAGLPVVVGTIDAYCETIAGGGLLPVRAVDVAGTSEILSLGVSTAVDGAGVYLAKLGEAGQFLCGPTQAGGESLRWFLQGFYPGLDPSADLQALVAEAQTAPPGCSGLVFVPYLNGERAPVWDAAARGAFLGVSLQHARPFFTRAVFEGVGYAIRHILEVCEAAAGIRAQSLTVCGGGSGSRFWNQIKADILQRPVFPAAVPETACLGAAMLAAVAVGLYPDLLQAGQAMARTGAMLEPCRENAAVYEANYQLYRAYYPAICPAYRIK